MGNGDSTEYAVAVKLNMNPTNPSIRLIAVDVQLEPNKNHTRNKKYLLIWRQVRKRNGWEKMANGGEEEIWFECSGDECELNCFCGKDDERLPRNCETINRGTKELRDANRRASQAIRSIVFTTGGISVELRREHQYLMC